MRPVQPWDRQRREQPRYSEQTAAKRSAEKRSRTLTPNSIPWSQRLLHVLQRAGASEPAPARLLRILGVDRPAAFPGWAPEGPIPEVGHYRTGPIDQTSMSDSSNAPLVPRMRYESSM